MGGIDVASLGSSGGIIVGEDMGVISGKRWGIRVKSVSPMRVDKIYSLIFQGAAIWHY